MGEQSLAIPLFN